MRMIYDAIKYAEKHHKGQFRKGSGAAYITHPIAVSYLLARYKASKNLVALIVACILHDLIEDTPVTNAQIAKKFGALVASLCHEMTNDPVMVAKLGKAEYQRRKLVGISSYGLVCKLVDRLHNIMDSPTKKTVADTLVLMAHLRSARKLTKTHKRIIVDIEAACREILPPVAELATADVAQPKARK